MTAGVNVHTTSESYIWRDEANHVISNYLLTRFHSYERHAYHKHVVVLQEMKTTRRRFFTTICTALTG